MSDLPDVPKPNAPAEPLLTVGSLGTVATTVLALVVSFGLKLDQSQQVAILAAVAALAPFIVAFVGRFRVFSPATTRALVKQALAEARTVQPTTRNTGVFDGPSGDGPRELR